MLDAETITIASGFVATYYGVKAGGPAAIVRELRSADTPRRYKVALALCALPIPGPVDEIVGVWVLNRLAARRAAREA